jgi:hypothetical protein
MVCGHLKCGAMVRCHLQSKATIEDCHLPRGQRTDHYHLETIMYWHRKKEPNHKLYKPQRTDELEILNADYRRRACELEMLTRTVRLLTKAGSLTVIGMPTASLTGSCIFAFLIHIFSLSTLFSSMILEATYSLRDREFVKETDSQERSPATRQEEQADLNLCTPTLPQIGVSTFGLRCPEIAGCCV